ncbi:pantoate--beta-alanine ligase [Nocardioides sp.]|uniref:pantoate--beta-alanine ligase n=1 Tax=Nocardioides sp. TaxID=35761 RepID=UPI002733A75A|nr:pantoate--beta-alanine ligase [Nocardioides sp.]MDP3893995.1 pantoate--beta-alanine ligase [Nocardioides sp.]
MSRPPALADTREELAHLLAVARKDGRRVAFVPTMGALHDGHAALMRTARAYAGDGPVVVSVFVNPLQFAPGEDLDRYPRTLEADLARCAAEGVDVVYAPGIDDVYPTGEPAVTVDPGPLGEVLEGASRPTHFRGVLTVVAKLFGLVRPDVAVFGEKDYQQLALIRGMTADLCLDVEVVGAETVREADGLALSSRNRYLSADDRQRATVLSRSLLRAREASGAGVWAALTAARAELDGEPGVDVDYLEIVATDLTPLPADVPAGTTARILVAARVGTTRLIDNLPITIGVSTRTRSSPGSTNDETGATDDDTTAAPQGDS